MVRACCIQCFGDTHLRYLIEHSSQGQTHQNGTCPICGATSVDLILPGSVAYKVLYDKLNELLNCYRLTRVDEFAGANIREELATVWGVFSEQLDNNRSKQAELIKFILEKRIQKQPELFQRNVILKNIPTEETSIFKIKTFNDFSYEIRNEQRFHLKNFNAHLFSQVLSYAVTVVKKDSVFYRARLKPKNKAFQSRDLEAPPNHLANAGRANTKGISHLYLADQEMTALKEVRAGLHNEVVIAKFEIVEDLRVIHLSELNQISPFLMSEGGVPLEVFAFNVENLTAIRNAVVEPRRSEDSYLEYLPIQYIVDFLKSEGYDGVQYASTMHKDGYNLVLFSLEKAEAMADLLSYEITDIHYNHSKNK